MASKGPGLGTELGAEVLTVFLLECLSGLAVSLAHACDGVDQIQPKIFPRKTIKTDTVTFTYFILLLPFLKAERTDPLQIL